MEEKKTRHSEITPRIHLLINFRYLIDYPFLISSFQNFVCQTLFAFCITAIGTAAGGHRISEDFFLFFALTNLKSQDAPEKLIVQQRGKHSVGILCLFCLLQEITELCGRKKKQKSVVESFFVMYVLHSSTMSWIAPLQR